MRRISRLNGWICFFRQIRHFSMKQAFSVKYALLFLDQLGILQWNVHFAVKCAFLFLDQLGIFQRNTHFAMKCALLFLDQLGILQWNVHFCFSTNWAFSNETRISPIAANLPWMHSSHGRCCDVRTQCLWQHACDNTLARMEMFAHNDSGFLVDGLLMLKSPAHAHAHNVNIHVAIHTSSRSWFFDPQRNSSGITSIPSYSSSSVSSSMYTFQCVDLWSHHIVPNGKNPSHIIHPFKVLWHRESLRTVSYTRRRTSVDKSRR